jgi:hypothetical protein
MSPRSNAAVGDRLCTGRPGTAARIQQRGEQRSDQLEAVLRFQSQPDDGEQTLLRARVYLIAPSSGGSRRLPDLNTLTTTGSADG